jgi:hypothetical protein
MTSHRRYPYEIRYTGTPYGEGEYECVLLHTDNIHITENRLLFNVREELI